MKDVICSVSGCGKPVEARTLCGGHLYRLQKYGDPMSGATRKGALRDFYENVVLKCDNDDCLIWPFYRTKFGYPTMRHEKRTVRVTRMVCSDRYGPPPTPRHEAAHSCGRGHEGCVNPRHLRWATRTENAADMAIHGTRLFGSKHGNAILNEDDVNSIRSLRGSRSQRNLAALFGVSQSTIFYIQSGKLWRNTGRHDTCR